MPKAKPPSRSRQGAKAQSEAAFPWIAEGLRPLAEPLANLKVDARNARKHDAENLAAIAASLREFGQLKPIVANRKHGTIEAGNGTFIAAKELGWTHLAVVWVEHDPHSHIGFSLADNRTAELAEWDEQLLDELLTEARPSLPSLFDELLFAELTADTDAAGAAADPTAADLFQIIVNCRDEQDQKELFEQMKTAGRDCRLLTV